MEVNESISIPNTTNNRDNCGTKTNSNDEADFETAVAATGFGRFNYMLLIVALPCCFAPVFETTTISYIVPSAECDLHLTLLDKGILNACTYAGMITSAVIWGYLADTMGRKKLLIIGYLSDAAISFLSSFSQSSLFLMICKYIAGFLICGPFAVLMSYLSEFHGTNYRPRVMMLVGTYMSLGTVTLPSLAWIIIPNTFVIDLYFIHLKSWQIYLAIGSIPSFLSGVLILFFPESPKFLMSQGRNAEALKIFQKIYHVNTGKDVKSYPIIILKSEKQQEIYSITNNNENQKFDIQTKKPLSKKGISLKDGMEQIMPMFRKPLLNKCILVFSIQFGLLWGQNTIRLWLPQLFTIVLEFEENLFNSTSPVLGDTNLCAILEQGINISNTNIAATNIGGVCISSVPVNMYMNTIIIGLTGFGCYLVAGTIINACGNKLLLVVGLLIPGFSAISFYWANNSLTILILSSLFVSVSSICSMSLIGVVVNLFPTTLRTMILSLLMMFGRIGSLIGNIIFPYLLLQGCAQSFFLLGGLMIACSTMCLILPQTNNKPLL